MGINRGKEFENKLKEQFDKLPDVSITRLYDTTNGYIGIDNPCDFIVYKKPNILYLECKAIHGNTLNFKSDIRKSQWEGLLKIDDKEVPGVIAGVICWFIDRDITIFIPILDLAFLQEKGYKSFNINDIDTKFFKDFIDFYKIEGKKKRVFFEYDLEKFLEDTKKDYE